MPNFLKTSTAAAAPVALKSTITNYNTATLIACKGLNGPTASPNTGTVKIGSSGNANEQPVEMAPGDQVVFKAPSGGLWDLQGIFLKVATDGDGVVVEYR